MQHSSPDLHSSPDNTAQWRAAVEERFSDIEARLSGTGGPEPSIKEMLEQLGEGREADSKSISALVKAVGESPDAATGQDGSGMRRQLAALVEAGKKPTIASYMAAIGTALLAIHQILKTVGILH